MASNNPYMAWFLRTINTYFIKFSIFDVNLHKRIPNYYIMNNNTVEKLVMLRGESIPMNIKFVVNSLGTYIFTMKIYNYNGKLIKSKDIVINPSSVSSSSFNSSNYNGVEGIKEENETSFSF